MTKTSTTNYSMQVLPWVLVPTSTKRSIQGQLSKAHPGEVGSLEKTRVVVARTPSGRLAGAAVIKHTIVDDMRTLSVFFTGKDTVKPALKDEVKDRMDYLHRSYDWYNYDG